MSRTEPKSGKSTTYSVPYFALTADPLTVYYDENVKSWNTSYVSIFYPSAMEMGQVTTTGTVPPMWGVPGSARDSVLIQKINAVSSIDGHTAWPTPLHPEDKGSQYALTPDERRALIKVMDLGGQYFARQNLGFVPATPAGK